MTSKNDLYLATINSICDNCYSICDGRVCNRVATLRKLLVEHIQLQKSYDVVCAELSIGTNYFSNLSKEEVKEHFNDKS